MLLRFGCENFRSFLEYQELSLVASSLKDPGPTLFEGQPTRYKVLPLAVIYGANASGKTNVLLALQTIAEMVRSSHSGNSPDGKIARKPFALNAAGKDRPSKFDCDFILEGSRFHYGFEFDDEFFQEEWLYVYEGGHRRSLFYREGTKFSFGKHLRGQNRITADITRRNSLFVSAAAQNNHEQLSKVYDYLSNIKFNMYPAYDVAPAFEKSSHLRDQAVAFLRSADTGISAAQLDYRIPAPSELKMMEQLVTFFQSQYPDQSDAWEKIGKDVPKEPRLRLGHLDHQNNAVFISMADESRGTKRALELALDVYDTLERGGVLVVDELEASLHTLLSSSLVGLFSSDESNPKQAQLICTTHDTNLLCSKHLRRDQIWFAEKDRSGQTHLYPLTAIKTRNTDNLERGYLQGRFGAVPFFGGISELFRPDDA